MDVIRVVRVVVLGQAQEKSGSFPKLALVPDLSMHERRQLLGHGESMPEEGSPPAGTVLSLTRAGTASTDPLGSTPALFLNHGVSPGKVIPECTAIYCGQTKSAYNAEKVDNAEVARSSVSVVVQPAFRFLAPIRQSA